MGYRHTLYDIVFVLHIMTAIVGFGGVMLNGIYGAAAKAAGGIEGLAIARANHKVSSIAEKAIFAVPVFGIALVAMSKGAIKFSQTWVWLAFLLYAIAITISLTVMVPGAKRLIALMTELTAVPVGGPPPGAGSGGPPPQVVEMEGIGKRLAIGGITLNLFLVTIVTLMIFKPGGLFIY
jgi:hypothetical protein